MKKTPWIIAIVSILLNLGLIYLFLIKGSTVKSTDSRIAIELPQEHQDFALKEMRDFLESVQQINEGILNNDATKVINAGKKSGGSVIDHAPKGLLGKLPAGFKQLGFGAHDLFDEIAVSAEKEFNPKTSQMQLNTLLNTCTACHSSYKFVLPKK